MKPATPTPNYDGPKRHREQARKCSNVPWVIDAVLVSSMLLTLTTRERGGAGDAILSEPEDGPPGRRYWTEDLEGHR